MFWEKLDKPFFVLAPMADVTDYAFRQLFVKYGKPDVLWTEFVSADGLLSEGRDKVALDLRYGENERPIVAQIFSGSVENIVEVGKQIEEMGFDGVDINMGCPDRSVEKQGSGANLMKDKDRAIEMIERLQEAVSIPVSVKTRLGYSDIDFDWIELVLKTKIPALTIHLRTRKELSLVDAHWELVRKIIEIRDRVSTGTKIIANGDVMNLLDAKQKAKEYGLDGAMIGRGCFGAPWWFSGSEKSVEEKMNVMVEHCEVFEKEMNWKSFNIMKKHFKAYVNGFDGASAFRVKLMECADAKCVKSEVKEFLKNANI